MKWVTIKIPTFIIPISMIMYIGRDATVPDAWFELNCIQSSCSPKTSPYLASCIDCCVAFSCIGFTHGSNPEWLLGLLTLRWDNDYDIEVGKLQQWRRKQWRQYWCWWAVMQPASLQPWWWWRWWQRKPSSPSWWWPKPGGYTNAMQWRIYL